MLYVSCNLKYLTVLDLVLIFRNKQSNKMDGFITIQVKLIANLSITQTNDRINN